jgi:hypothetical protein
LAHILSRESRETIHKIYIAEMDEVSCGVMGLSAGVVLGIDVLDESGLV